MYLHVLEEGDEEDAAVANADGEQLDVVLGPQPVDREGEQAETIKSNEPDCHGDRTSRLGVCDDRLDPLSVVVQKEAAYVRQKRNFDSWV